MAGTRAQIGPSSSRKRDGPVDWTNAYASARTLNSIHPCGHQVLGTVASPELIATLRAR